jgi:general secretion pathway protein A
MYTSFFGLTENPFSLTPDPRYLYLSRQHKEALDYLLYGINERKGFIVITGGIGTGKTTLCRAMLTHLPEDTKSALVFNPFIADIELLQTIAGEFGIEKHTGANTRKGYVDRLNEFLLHNFSSGGNAVLLIDEAQNLSHNVLEQIRMLSNLETEKEKLVQIVLVGQPELGELLASPSLRQLNERIPVRYDLRPLSRRDVRDYVEHRLVVAGGRGNVRFTNGAIHRIYNETQGNPRRINAICDRSLLIAYAKETHTVSKRIAHKARRDLYGAMKLGSTTASLPTRRWVPVGLLLLALAMLAVLSWELREDIFRPASLPPVETTLPTSRYAAPIPPKPEPKPTPSLFLDDAGSLAELFRLFNTATGSSSLSWDGAHLSLISFSLEPEYYVMLKKPFRVSMQRDGLPDRYLLILEADEEGATALDTSGRPQPVTRDFILEHWGKRVSWIFPQDEKDQELMKGMRLPEVRTLQKILDHLGYPLERTGEYDTATADAVKKFQTEFGLKPDGIFGPRTRALLYQMVGFDELHS